MNIIFDLDATLITNIERTPIERPFLKPLIKWVFRNSETVAIWTASKVSWYNTVNESVLEPILEELRDEDKKDYQFVFVYTRKDIGYKQKNENEWWIVKPLQKLWSDKNLPHTRENTLIIDDSPSTFMLNSRNAVQVSKYSIKSDKAPYDYELVLLLKVLILAKARYEVTGDVKK